jgi:hypothetical protein
MAWSLAVGQLTKIGADDKSLPLKESVRLLTMSLIEAGSAERIGNTVFLNCADGFCSIRDDGFIEFGAGAA